MCGGWRWVRAAGVGAVLAALSLLSAHAQAPTPTPTEAYWDFEVSANGWSPTHTSVSIEDVAGGRAARLTSAGGASISFCSQYWADPASQTGPGAVHRASALVHLDHPEVTLARMDLRYLDATGGPTGQDVAAVLADPSPISAPLEVTSSLAPEGTAYVQICFSANAPDGSSFAVDDVRLVQVTAPAPPTPTPEPTEAPTSSPTATPASTTSAPSATPRATSTPAAPSFSLLNADFEDLSEHWDTSRASVTFETAIAPEFGRSMVVRASSTSTVWVQQLVAVAPGFWYEASAVLAPLQDVGSGWVRIAWYASPTGSGSQMSTVESERVASPPRNALAETFATVTTGPVQAPQGAHSARVRILLAPNAPGAALAVDNVTFDVTAPPKPTATPTPTPVPTATSTPTPTSTPVAPGLVAAPPPAEGGASNVEAAPTPAVATTDAQRWLRITEVMPNPLQPGRDTDYEWIEITNLGPTPASLGGLVLRDNSRITPLPEAKVAAGGKVVVAARLAEVVTGVRLEDGIGNGLGNEADRLDLLGPDGVLIDSLAYGPGTPLPAPEAGASLHRWFDRLGFPAGAAVALPSPGVYSENLPASVATETPTSKPTAPAALAAPESTPPQGGSFGGSTSTWVFLLTIAGGVLGGAAAQRLSALARSGRDAKEPPRADETEPPSTSEGPRPTLPAARRRPV